VTLQTLMLKVKVESTNLFFLPLSVFVFVQVPPSSFYFIFLNVFSSIYSNIKMNFGVSIFSLYNISVLLLVGLTFRRRIDMKYELII
jgi:hypothetical protein